MSVLVTYQSKTGFTRKYAQWISQELSCDLRDLSEVHPSDVKKYELVIHGGWIMGGMINGLEKIKNFNPQRLIVFGVGFTPRAQMKTEACIDANKLGKLPFFYYQGGMNPKKMGFMARTMVRMVTKKPLEYADYTNKNEIGELVKLALSAASE